MTEPDSPRKFQDDRPLTPEEIAALEAMRMAQATGDASDSMAGHPALAKLLADSRTEIAGAWSLQRAQHGEMTHWAIINFAALTGKIGLPGQGVGFSWHYGSGGMPQSGKAGPAGMSQGRNLVKTIKLNSPMALTLHRAIKIWTTTTFQMSLTLNQLLRATHPMP